MVIYIKIIRRDVLIFLLVLLGAFLVFTKLSGQASNQRDIDKHLNKFAVVYEIIRDNYVKEMPTEDIFKNGLKGMLNSLDPYSDYFSAKEYKQFQSTMKGEFFGVGMEITMEDGVLTVITPLEDTPAFRAGILAGDRVLEVDGESIEGLTLVECVNRIIGKKGTKVTLTVLHKGESSPVEITITRDKIKIKSVKRVRIIDDKNKVGFLQITNFQEDTVGLFEEAVRKLQENGMKSLIIDLRFNGGGLMIPSVELANKFIRQGVIVSTKGRVQKSKHTFEANSEKATLSELPLVILVNGGSASASEIFAGAIQDHSKGVLVGSRTYGKGSVQTLLEIPEDKSAVKLTVSQYYTPSGKCLQRQKDKNYGLDPDILVELTPAQEAELLKARSQEEVITPPDEQPPEPPPEFKDIQLQKALEVLTSEK